MPRFVGGRIARPLVFLFPLLLCCSAARADESDARVSALFSALKAQDAAKLSERLQQFPSLINAHQDGQTLLSQAASFGFQDLVTLLLKRGANVNAKDSNGETPLHQAIEFDNRTIATLLIKHGGRDVTNPILDAIVCGDASRLRQVLTKLSPELSTAELAGYDVDEDTITQEPGQKPIHLIAIGPWVTGITPLDAAVLWRHPAMVKLLLAKGANITGEDRDGYAPLHTAVGLNDKKTVLMLLAKGANVNAKTVFHGVQTVTVTDGLTPLHIAAQVCGPDMISLLTAHGARLNARDSNGETPLFYAIDRGSLKIVATLLKHGANLNAKNTQEVGTMGGGETPLHHAVIRRDFMNSDKAKVALLPIMALLIAHGANVNAKDGRGLTPLGLTQGDDNIAALLRQHGGRNFGRSLFPEILPVAVTTIVTPTDSPPGNPPASP